MRQANVQGELRLRPGWGEASEAESAGGRGARRDHPGGASLQAEAWEEAQAYAGPEPAEIFHCTASAALIRARSSAPLENPEIRRLAGVYSK